MDSAHETHRVFPGRSPRLRPLLVLGMVGVVMLGVAFGVTTWLQARSDAIEVAAFDALVNDGTNSVDLGDPMHGHGAMETGAMGSGSDHLSPAEREELDAQLALAAAKVPRYDTMAEAEAVGYVPVSPNVDGVGSHWTKWSLVDEPFDPRVPSQLLFEEVRAGQGPELVAFSYWIQSDEAPEGFAGGTDHWHRHQGLCFNNGLLIVESDAERATCEGDWINGSDLWMLHAWIVPGLENRFGMFHAVNPRLCERYCE